MATASYDNGVASLVVSREEQGQNEVFMLNGHEEQEGVNKFEEKDGNSKNYDESDATVDRHRKILHTDYLKLQDEYQRLQQQNNKLQLLLAEYFQRKKCESRFSDECTDEEKEQCYHNALAKLKELQEECVDQKVHFEDQLKKLQEERQKTEDMVETEMEIFVVYKREIILQAMKRHGGKRVSLKDLERLQQVEERREKELARVQLENIKLNMRFSKYQEKFKIHSIGVDGQHLIDYEELKMENHTYNEKIEEQKEALQKVKKKISSTTHTLTQVKKKQEFIKAENLVKRGSLMKLEAHVNEKKEALKKLKQSRDSLWLDVKCLRCKSGLLMNVDLLQDFEDHRDSNDALKEKLDYLKMRYVQLTQNCREFRRKVQYAKQT